ncbi:MAG: hypothetical protein WBZ37_24490, partial [Mycobacterium sp.]
MTQSRDGAGPQRPAAPSSRPSQWDGSPTSSAREISRQTFLRGAVGALAVGAVFGSAQAAADPNTSGWQGLSTAIGGQVLTPGDGQFATAK